MEGKGSFVNDVPASEEPECKVPADSDNEDNCAQYNEFGDCKLCNSGYELLSDASCKLKEEDIEEEEEEEEEDPKEPNSEDIIWAECTNSVGKNGFKCFSDDPQEC